MNKFFIAYSFKPSQEIWETDSLEEAIKIAIKASQANKDFIFHIGEEKEYVISS